MKHYGRQLYSVCADYLILLDKKDSIYEKQYEKPLEIEERARREKREMSNITFDGQIDG